MAATLVVSVFAFYWAWITWDFGVYLWRDELRVDVLTLLGALVVVSGWVAILI